jgi:hypothetical protein
MERSLWYQLNRRLSGSHIRCGCGGDKKNSQLLPGIKFPIIQPKVTKMGKVWSEYGGKKEFLKTL